MKEKIKLKWITKIDLLEKNTEGKKLLKEYHSVIRKINKFLNN